MRWKDIDFNSKTWRIPETKNGEPLTLPLMEQAIEILQERKKANGNNTYVFPGSGAEGHLADPKP